MSHGELSQKPCEVYTRAFTASPREINGVVGISEIWKFGHLKKNLRDLIEILKALKVFLLKIKDHYIKLLNVYQKSANLKKKNFCKFY